MKVLLHLLAAGVVGLLAACSGPDPEAESGDTATPANVPSVSIDTAPPPPGFAPTASDKVIDPHYDNLKAWTGDLDAMAQRRLVRVLTVYSVGRYYLDGARESGLVKEVSRQLAVYLNKRYNSKPRLHVIVVPVARDQLIPALLAGKGDIIIAGLTPTPERQALIDFTEPASKPLSEILLTGPGAPPLPAIDDLAGKRLYLRRSSSYWQSAEALNQTLIARGKPAIHLEPVSELLEDDDLVEMVNAGLLPWVVVDDYKLPWWREMFSEVEAREDIVLRSGAQLAWGMRKDSPQLQAALNTFLEDHREGTLIGNVLANRYIRDFDWAEKATAPQALAQHAELAPLFRKYAEAYQFDPYMLAAQGYQESRLKQSARSQDGAVGIMQIKHSTARDKNVGIASIDQIEDNIHAGTKYLAFLRDRYFDAATVQERERWLLALAAYNMGPSRMINLRNRAEKMGYDRDVWFDNVELAAAKHVGREPVTYVANIYKYYLAYSMSEAQLAMREAARERAGIAETTAAGQPVTE